MAQRLKRLPPMWETQVRSLGWDDPLERERYIFIYIYRERESPGDSDGKESP